MNSLDDLEIRGVTMDFRMISEALHAQPFRAFTLRLADGRALYIPHPDFVAVSPRHVLVIDPRDEGFSIVEPLLIVSLDFITASQGNTPSGNGS
jgi:hypothetical protein